MAEIAGIAATLLGPAIFVGKSIFGPIKRQCDYLWCFNSNIQSLRDETKNLEDARAGVEMQVAIAKNNVEIIVPEVETWLGKATDILVNTSAIEIEILNLQNGCLTIKSRFSLSRKAKKIFNVMKELQENCRFSHISQPAPSAAMISVPLGQTYEFESRKQIEEDIMLALRSKEVNVIGICGMGGVGKTTMAKKIMNRVRKEHLFDEIVMVVVREAGDKLKVQSEIAELFGLKLEEENLSARAHKLRMRLLGTKRVLIVLDDVWKKLELEDLGIPFESGLKETAILVTSRDRGVLEAMDAEKVCVVQILPEREAWFLFKEKARICVDDLDLLPIAQEIVTECKGLPLALITVGRALKDKNNKSIWEDALQQLKSLNPTDMPHFLAEVYNPIKVSYDLLGNQHARSIFLLCCLFPEDQNIPVGYLTWYSLGLCMFKGIRTLKEARNRTCTLVDMLKSHFLLLDGRDEHHFKMHDVVRDVAIFIASEKGDIDLSFSSMDLWRGHSYCNCSWISVIRKASIKSPMELVFPSLRLLLIDNFVEEELDDSFFEEMTELNVLSIRSVLFKSLPKSIQLLKNLRMLHIRDSLLEDISAIGQLSSLEILICRGFRLIKKLPVEIGNLNNLRYFEFSHCEKLETIAPGVISNLVQLEELRILSSFDKWERQEKGKERKNAALSELECLPNLTCMEIEIQDFSLAAEQVSLSPKIVKYDIKIAAGDQSYVTTHEKKLYLELPREVTLGHWIHIVLTSTEYLYSRGDGSNKLNLAEAQNMRSLSLEYCSTIKKLVNMTTSTGSRSSVFPLLESLSLTGLDTLEDICDGSISADSNSFRNLKELTLEHLPALKYLWRNPDQNVSLRNLSYIYILECDKLHNLFSVTMARSLLQLQELQIDISEKMEEVFWNDESEILEGESHITFPKLKTLTLCSLPRLTTFCKGIESIEFPMLTRLHIQDCPKLKNLICSVGNNLTSAGNHDDYAFHLFCNQKVAFGSLKEICIQGYNKISHTLCRQIPLGFFSGLEQLTIGNDSVTSIFSSSIARSLVNLIKLTIQSCQEMIKVIEDEENVLKTSAFPTLEDLELKDLRKLENFCNWRCDFELPSLKRVTIVDCPEMKSFTLGNLSTPNLESILIDYEVITAKDLNGVLQQHFRAKVKL